MNSREALELIVEQASRGELIFPTNMAASLRLQRALDDPDCHLDSAAEMVLAEPLIAARLVAIANSVAYTRFGGYVNNVRSAVNLLGFKPLRSLVAAIVVRQLCSAISAPLVRHKAELLWQHCSSVAALAKVVAREFTNEDPETALFAGIVHEIGGFYLLSRAGELPVLLEELEEESSGDSQLILSHSILRILKIPKPVTIAVEHGSVEACNTPPVTTADVLSLANRLAAVPSPLSREDVSGRGGATKGIEFDSEGKTLQGVLYACADEIKSITEALQA